MSQFQTTVSTIAALGTITVTGITAYKVYDSMQQNNFKQQLIIQDLKNQLAQRQMQPIPQPQTQITNPLISGSATVPPPPQLPHYSQ